MDDLRPFDPDPLGVGDRVRVRWQPEIPASHQYLSDVDGLTGTVVDVGQPNHKWRYVVKLRISRTWHFARTELERISEPSAVSPAVSSAAYSE